MRRWTDEKSRRLARAGLLFALCCALSLAESALTGWVGLPPGVKPGLANVVVMYALFFLGGRSAAALVLLKAAFGALTRGLSAGLLSLCGGGLSLAVLWALEKAGKGRWSWVALSVCGALAHNLGQLAALAVWMGSTAVFYYWPVLLLSGVGCGALSATVLRLAAPALRGLPTQGGRRPHSGGDRPA